jgi:urease accessory protein
MTIAAQPLQRDDPGHVLPVPLPRAFAPYASQVTALGVGHPGKVGLMELTFERRGDSTRLVRHYYRSPLQMFQPIYLDAERPDMPFVILLQNGGGMVQGDRYRIDLRCGPGASAHVTTQSAGKLYKCESNFVTQMIDISVEAGAYFEYLPDMTIPFRDSRFFQHIRLHIEPSATAIIGDTLAPGRTAHGEQHDYTLFIAQLEAFGTVGDLLVADTIRLEPGRCAPTRPAMLGGYDALGVLYVFDRSRPAAELVRTVRAAIADEDQTLCGVSELPNGAGLSVRLLGPSAAQVERARAIIWNAVRLELIGVPAPNLRKA